ncbi:MAG: glycosyltransferase family 2 protein [Candidatus Kerfeldbacteria bacterium]
MNNPLVYIIILNWNGIKDTRECLKSLKKISYQNYKVILIDNGSENNEGELIKKEYSEFIHLIKNKENLGFAEGNNVGITYALNNNSDYVLFLNNDTTVESNFLDQMVLTVENNKENNVGMVASKIFDYYKKNHINAVWSTIKKNGIFIGQGYDMIDNGQYDNTKYVFGPSGCCGLYSSKLLREIKMKSGFFDKDLFAYHEDIDLNFRAQLINWKCVYDSKSIIYHKHSRSLGNKSPFKTFLNAKNNNIVILKNFPTQLLLQYSFLIIGRNILSIIFNTIILNFSMVKGKLYVFKNIKQHLKKRKYIQSKKIVSTKYIKSLFGI